MGRHKGTFIDLFAGCGGLSLGLMQAGWKGIFAVERNDFAFRTLKHNLVDRRKGKRFAWPPWLPQKNITVSRLLKKYGGELKGLRGEVDLVTGGPPCQGFSIRGGRGKGDSRNGLYKDYIEFVKLLQPRFLLIENVGGINLAFGRKNCKGSRKAGRPPKSFTKRIDDALGKIGYETKWNLVKAVDYGVPQIRPRYIMIGVNRSLMKGTCSGEQLSVFFQLLANTRHDFLTKKGLRTGSCISVRDAISDLETEGRERTVCADSSGFEQIIYERPKTRYQRIMHGSLNGAQPDSLRLAQHREKTIKTYRNIMNFCRQGITLNDAEMAKVGSKHSIVWLSPDNPSHTLTTLPDDLLHYSEPRILTVRECARLQTFPDWFEFKGNYTTGGSRRKKECPRYTQVGNAVPPLLAEALGRALIGMLSRMSAVFKTIKDRDGVRQKQ